MELIKLERIKFYSHIEGSPSFELSDIGQVVELSNGKWRAEVDDWNDNTSDNTIDYLYKAFDTKLEAITYCEANLRAIYNIKD